MYQVLGYLISLIDTKYFKQIAIGILLVIVIGLGSYKIYSMGQESIQTEWDKAKLVYAQTIAKVHEDYKAKEVIHMQENQRIANELLRTKEEYGNALSSIRDEFTNRMLDSEKRADVYKRQAQSGTIESNRLAIHAAKLDRLIEEGRRLVRELRETIGLRDSQIKLLSDQINSDRALLK